MTRRPCLGRRWAARLAVLALFSAFLPGAIPAQAGVGTSPSIGVAFLQDSRSGGERFVTVELSVDETRGRRFAGHLTVGGEIYEAEGTTSASGKRNITAHGDGTVVTTGQVVELDDGGVLYDGKIRQTPDEQEKGVVIQGSQKGVIAGLEAFSVDPDDPPPTGVADIYDGSFASATSHREGRAILELESRAAASAFRCDAELSIIEENNVVTMNGFTGECSVSGDRRLVGVLMGENHGGGANLLFLDGTYSTGEQPPRDTGDDVEPAPTASIHADYNLRFPDGAEERGTLEILGGGEQRPRCIPDLNAEPEHA